MRKWSNLLMQPFYPGMGNRGTVDCPALPEKALNICSQEEAERIDAEKQAWDRYFSGIGPRPNADQSNA